MNVNKLNMFFFTKFQNLIIVTYKVCHWFRLTSRENYFWVNFDQFWIDCRFFEAAGAVVKIVSSLKPNQRKQI